MIFEPTHIPGAYVIGLEKREDERGFFARGWCAREFAAHGLWSTIAQVNIAHNRARHTLRGMHFQAAPHGEDKLIRCIGGAAHFVVLDLRPESPAYRRHVAVALSAADGRALCVPKGCANGYLTLADNTDLLYMISEFYAPGFERGLRWNDPALGIAWPAAPAVMSDKDRDWPDFQA